MKNANLKLKCLILLILAILAVCLGICVGSVSINIDTLLAVFKQQLLGIPLSDGISSTEVSILWTVRIPRVCAAFLVGGMLSVSGAMTQSLLQNPLASSYTLGVSSGAALGAALVIVGLIPLPVSGFLALPIAGFAFGFATIFAVLAISRRVDANVSSNTIVLLGVVVSLFLSALITIIASFFHDFATQLYSWQLGSFSGRKWSHVQVLLPCAIAGFLGAIRFHRELDIMTFGDEQSMSIGVDVPKVKKLCLIVSAFLTGTAVCFTGIIGFVDLIIPHVVRRFFGSAHRYVLPACFLAGGAFLVIADTAGRTIVSPREIAVGAVTSLLGAPFFIWLYFRKK